MTDERPPVLTYQPAPPRLRRRGWQITMVALAALVAIGIGLYRRRPPGPVLTSNSRTVTLAPGRLRADTNAIEMPYGKWVFFRSGSHTVAVRVAKGTPSPIDYEWVDLSPPTTAPASPVPTTATTSDTAGWGHIVAGAVRLNWSGGGNDSGWIYWNNLNPTLAVSSRTVDDLEEARQPDPTETWYTRKGVAKLAGHTAPLPSTPAPP